MEGKTVDGFSIVRVPLATDEADAAVDKQERRWPVLYSVIFVLASSILLWALIIAGVAWLIT